MFGISLRERRVPLRNGRVREAEVATPTSSLPDHGRRTEPTHMIGEDLFRDVLARERKRADRFEQPFVLVLLAVKDGNERERRWNRLVEALSETARDTDVTGWYERGASLGLIRPLTDGATPEAAQGLASSVGHELGSRLTPGEIHRCSIRWETYPPATSAPTPAFLERDHRQTPQQAARDGTKRVLDILGSSALLIASAPLFLVIAAVIKLTSRGPVFFPQQRIGTGGRPFTMMKFRTMQVNADPKVHQQYVENFIQSSGNSATGEKIFKIVNDPRVTPIGHFLRRSSLDELPQLWNVLKGEMSLVGPRPPLPYEVARYKNWHRRRVLEAKPGITGLWQVTGRSQTTFDEMVRLDLRYARHYSVWTDLRILMATPRAVISGKGAH